MYRYLNSVFTRRLETFPFMILKIILRCANWIIQKTKNRFIILNYSVLLFSMRKSRLKIMLRFENMQRTYLGLTLRKEILFPKQN